MILADLSDAQVLKLAARPTPKPMVGTWRLVAPDGREWVAESPVLCLSAEINDRVPPDIALARIRREMMKATKRSKG